MSFTFSSTDRLRSRTEFTAVQDHGRRVATKYMTLLGRPNDRGFDRLGIIASRRFGGAVARNRAKRRIREIFRRRPLEATAAHSGRALDVVIIPRRELLTVPMPVIETDFHAAVRKLRGVK